MNPKILILLSAYNGEDYILEQLDSIEKQQDVDVHFLIRDDGSKDSTFHILETYQKSHDNVELLHGENLGYQKSFARLMSSAYQRFPEIKYFAFCDQDDFWLPDKLSRAVSVLQREEDVAKGPCLYLHDVFFTTSKLNIISKSDFSQYEMPGKYSPIIDCRWNWGWGLGCAMVFNRTALEDVLKIGYPSDEHDAIMYIVCSALGQIVFDPVPAIYHRLHQHNTTRKMGKSSKSSSLYFRILMIAILTVGRSLLRKQDSNNLHIVQNLLQGQGLTQDERSGLQAFANYRNNVVNRIKFLFHARQLGFYSGNPRLEILWMAYILAGKA